MYISVIKSQGCWLVGTVRLHTTIESLRERILTNDHINIDPFFIYDLDADSDTAPRPLKKIEIETLLGI